MPAPRARPAATCLSVCPAPACLPPCLGAQLSLQGHMPAWQTHTFFRNRTPAGESLNPEEAEAAEEELHQLEQQLLDEHVLEMPRVPSGKEAAASAARQEQPAAPAAGAAAAGAAEGEQQLEASLAELPSVPKTKVQPQQPVQAEAAAEQEEEPERVLVAT